MQGKLLNKIYNFSTTNYRRTLNITRGLLILTFVFCNLYDIDSSFALFNLMFRDIMLNRSLLVYLFYGIFTWGIFEVLIRIITSMSLNFSGIHVLPREKIVLLILMLAVPRNILFGLLKLTYFLTPVVAMWGDVLLEFVVTLPFAIFFWKIIKQKYLSNGNAPYVLKSAILVFLGYYAFFTVWSYAGVL